MFVFPFLLILYHINFDTSLYLVENLPTASFYSVPDVTDIS